MSRSDKNKIEIPMATVAAPKDFPHDTAEISRITREKMTGLQDMAAPKAEVSAPKGESSDDYFGHFMPKEEGDIKGEEAFFVEENIPAPPPFSAKIPTLVPAAKEALRVNETIDPEALESAESMVRAEVSEDVLSLAMSIQEEASQAQAPKPTHLPKEPNGTHGEFPTLKKVILSEAPQPLVAVVTKEIGPIDPVIHTDIPESAELTTGSLARKPEGALAPVTSNAKTREGASPTNDVSLKETARALEGAERESEQEDGSTFEEERALKEMHLKDSKGDGNKTAATGKSFADNLANASAKPEGGGVTADAAPVTRAESADGKAVEAAFNRAQETTSFSGAKATSQGQSSQHSLPPQASAQEQIAFSIKNHSGKGKSEITLQLRPDSLGRVNVKIDVNKEGNTYVVVATERSETRDLLQQDASKLTALLEESGMTVDGDDVSYNLFGEHAQQDKENQEDTPVGDPQHTTDELAHKVTGPMIPLEMSEVRVPKHGGTWEARA